MPAQQLPRTAEAYAAAQRQEIAAAVAAIRRQWRRVRTTDIAASYAVIEPALLAIVTTAQGRVASGAQAYVPAVLDETGQSRAMGAFADVATSPLIGVAGDGRPVDSLLYESVIGAKARIGEGLAASTALADRGRWLSMAVGTLLSDTGRQSESLAMGVRPVGGYVRMLNPPSCARCVVLAGKWYRKNTGFARHPGCDCRHIPASESMAGDLRVDGFDYVDSLPEAGQDKLLGKAGADAWRAGGDLNQIVNARRSMYTAQGPGVRKLYTSEGTATRRGWAYRRRADGLPAGSGARPRLMPESIALIASNRDEYLRLLRMHGYIL